MRELSRQSRMRSAATFRPWVGMLVSALTAWTFGACASGPPISGTVPLVEQFFSVSARESTQGESGSFQRHSPVTRGGRQLDAMILIAPATIRALTEGLSGPCLLKLEAAPVFNIGDGMQLTVSVEDGAKSKIVFERGFDAGRMAVDRKWTGLAIPLELSGTKEEGVEIRVSGGPQGDLVADWLALAELRLEQNKK
jgi:hypothetical protein